ncbi:rho GTPase-activating protein 17-like [Homarus americanus]|uniref:rho GTPase-activating protein 17-like n=1 Tax=Homarus americanus TaxID=6706 RepID=UPI001C442D08|nr:rho GTPase-activating protein 17-like [Homarus americanus]
MFRAPFLAPSPCGVSRVAPRKGCSVAQVCKLEREGSMMGVRAAWLLLLLALGAATASPPSPAGTKRSIEDIQFGNQQNPPVSLLDDNALPGAFPSSETSEENVSGKEGTGEPLELQQQQHRQQIEQQQQEEQDQQEDTQQDDTQKDDLDRSMIPAAEANSWNKASSPRLHLYQPRWDMPLMISGATYPTAPPLPFCTTPRYDQTPTKV